MIFHEHAPRSLIKTITYRILIITSNSIIVYLLTNDLKIVATVTIIESITSTLIYYFHERVWNKIHWGKSHAKPISGSAERYNSSK